MLYISQDILDKIKIILPILAGLVTAIWAFYKFYYLEKKEEKEKTSHLIVSSKLKKVGKKKSFNIIELNVDITNKSKTKMFVLSDYINIFGISMASEELTEEEFLKITKRSIENKKYASLHRFVKLNKKRVVYCGKIFDYDDYWWLEPKEKLNVNRFVYIPESFDYAKMIVNIYYSMNKEWLNVKTVANGDENGLTHEVKMNIKKFKGENFDWHNKQHLKLHNKFRNAEINNTSLLFIK